MPALLIENLYKRYNNGFNALQSVSLNVAEGDFFALLGPNGAGKSTILGVVSSLVKKTSGRVSIFGLDIDTQFTKAKMNLGVVPQEFNFNMFETTQKILVIQAGYYGISAKTATKRSENLLKKLGLWDKRNTASRLLSGGMKRRLMIARALMHKPKLLILDEPTAGVDIEMRRSMWQFLQEINAAGTTIILTTHYLEEAENLCRNIAIINQGVIIQNTSMRQLLSQLNSQTMILDISSTLSTSIALDGYAVRQINEYELEVDIAKEQNLNYLFQQLSDQNIKVQSMRNRSNRLETLFVSMLDKSTQEKHEQ